MARQHDEEWREFYTEVGFRHGFELGAKAIRDAAAQHLSAKQITAIDAWIAGDVGKWKQEYFRKEEPPVPPKI